MKTKYLLPIFCLLLCAANVQAQCNLKRVKKNGITTVETDEIYIYKRTGPLYNAIAFKAVYNGTTTSLRLKYTTNGPERPTSLYIKLTNGDMIARPIVFMAKTKTDDAQTFVTAYNVTLAKADLEKILALRADSIGVMSAAKTSLREIDLPDHDVIQQLFNCLLSK
jgi:hypothetical protein